MSKMTLYMNIGYGLLVGFALVGSLFRASNLPVIILVLTVLAWTSTEIVRRAFASWSVLRVMSKGDEAGEDVDDDDLDSGSGTAA